MSRYFFITLLLSVFLLSCEDYTPQSEKDEEIIQEYISQNNLDATRHYTGIYYIIHEEGYGTNPTYYSQVKVNYKGYFTTGEVFDEGSMDYAALSGMITGWQIGLPLIKQGGSITLIVPSAYGYGSGGNWDGTIPGNTVLVFDITLIDHK